MDTSKLNTEAKLIDFLDDFLQGGIKSESEISELENKLRIVIPKELTIKLDELFELIKSRLINGKFVKSHKHDSIFPQKQKEKANKRLKSHPISKEIIKCEKRIEALKTPDKSKKKKHIPKKTERFKSENKETIQKLTKIKYSVFRPEENITSKSSIYTVKKK